MINWMLEEEGVEDVACTVEDIKVGGNGVKVMEGWTRGTIVKMMEGSLTRCSRRCNTVETVKDKITGFG